MNSNYAPICLFTYNRLYETKETVNALKNNLLSKDSELFIFSDGPKNESVKGKVKAVREFLKSVNGFKSITIFESKIPPSTTLLLCWALCFVGNQLIKE